MLSLIGVPLEAALAATPPLRVFTVWLPLLLGSLLILATLRTDAAKLSMARKPSKTGH
jgi:uncharacterized membrane protein YbhN (UPF0104 family)